MCQCHTADVNAVMSLFSGNSKWVKKAEGPVCG